MHKVMVTGAGKIGCLIACFLADSQAYEVHLADMAFEGAQLRQLLKELPEIKTVAVDVSDEEAMQTYLQQHSIQAVVSSLPYFLNPHVAQAARKANVHYFDLTEDVAVTQTIRSLAQGASTAFIPQCGLAPGFIGIAAYSLMQEFEQCLHARLRVGALPQHSSNALHYSLTWSTDGVINEYGNTCYGIKGGERVALKPLDALEVLQFEGRAYEAFNTSGGLGSLSESCLGKIQSLNYKTIRYPGHCEKMRFLMNELRLNEDRDTLKRILERAIPKTARDMVLIYVAIEGVCQGDFIEKNYMKTIYPFFLRGMEWSAIQTATASSVCAVLDQVLAQPEQYQGLILQERFSLADMQASRFGQCYVE